MHSPEDIQQAVTLLKSHLQVLPEEPLGESSDPIDEYTLLKERLSQLIAYLLANDFNRLLNGLYRMDVSEAKFKQAMAGPSEKVSDVIADLIIERELEKIAFRKKYK
ncbi:hypothetical protein [Algivirga pacifica]|uniref:Uncharacterized protein n=1 Tax=Algivirga pacifica TaxID=1162670 RepID=A0ABP9DEF8_9BACT